MYHVFIGAANEAPTLAKSRRRPLAWNTEMQNEIPRMAASAAPPSWQTALAAAVGRVDFDAWAAIALIVVGWFVLDTVQVAWPMKHGIAFYDIAVIIKTPMRLFTGVSGARGVSSVLFTLICLATLLATLTPYIWRNRFAWLACIAPLALIVLCALLLYVRTPPDLFPTQGGGDTLGNDVRHLANHLFHRATAGVARKVTVGAGVYLALIGSVYLAVRGIRRYRSWRA
jgi:hypothetical protein